MGDAGGHGADQGVELLLPAEAVFGLPAFLGAAEQDRRRGGGERGAEEQGKNGNQDRHGGDSIGRGEGETRGT